MITVQNLVCRDYTKYVHATTYTQAPAHTCIWTIHNLIYSQLKQITEEDNNAEQKTWQVYFLEKEMS